MFRSQDGDIDPADQSTGQGNNKSVGCSDWRIEKIRLVVICLPGQNRKVSSGQQPDHSKNLEGEERTDEQSGLQAGHDRVMGGNIGDGKIYPAVGLIEGLL